LSPEPSHGGARVVEVLARHGVESLFTLCGGHISPILVAARARGLAVIDVRHEAAALFAADATARLTGRPGVAAVTAGPGLTNTVTALQNARMAQSPLLLLGGATATVLRGRGSLQDIDQQALAAPLVKWQGRATTVAELEPLVERALWIAREGVPGPVFVECPVDLLYPESVAREWYGVEPKPGERQPALGKRVERLYLRSHLRRIFRQRGGVAAAGSAPPAPPPDAWAVRRAARALARSERPVAVIGSQATLDATGVAALAAALDRLGLPVYLSGGARGLLGARHARHFRHRRKEALREADLVLLAGVPCDFRLDYGRSIGRRAILVAANRSREDLLLNRRPAIASHGDPALFLIALAERCAPRAQWRDWLEILRRRDHEREAEIARRAADPGEGGLNPLRLLTELDAFLDDRALLVADGGDFVGTAAYTVRPVGGGFALGARRARPEAEVWVLWGDGSVAYSLAEIDTFARHGLGMIGLVGNDAAWGQIARDQVEILGDDVGTRLASTDYHRAAEALGGVGLLLDRPEAIAETFAEARRQAAAGRPVLINARLARSDFRKGSISL